MARWIAAVTAVLSLCGTLAFPDAIPKSSVEPIEAELTSDLAARALRTGSTIHAQVAIEWRSAQCVLRKGAILEGHVLSIVPRTNTVKDSELSLAFTKAQCSDQRLSTLNLALVALAAPPQQRDLGVLNAALPFKASGSGGIAALKMAQMNTNLNLQMAQIGIGMPPLPAMKMGDVLGISRLKISIGSGPESSSVLRMRGRDVALDAHTMLLLVPMQVISPAGPTAISAPASGSRAGGAAAPAASSAPLPALPDTDADIDLCAPPQCNTALPAAHAIDVGHPTAGISIHELGYAARPNKVIGSFDHDECLAYLGPGELLVTFRLHILATRHSLGKAGYTRRVIRAALVDTRTLHVTHTVDWELSDFDDFLWPLADGRILVHVASDLRVYGPGLRIQNRMHLNGPLAFVRISPDKNFVAVGTVNERHSPELHAQLREELGADPEEDINIDVVDRSFEIIAHSAIVSTVMPPVLLNEGQAMLLAQPGLRYRVAMLGWDSRASTVARFTSGCKPQLSSFAPDLIFLVTCDKQANFRNYSVLRPDGKPILVGRSTLNEVGHSVEVSSNQQFFVVKVVESSLPVLPDSTFSAADFTSERLDVYRTADSKRLFAVRVGAPSSSLNGYALAPDGSQLAVLADQQVSLYSIPSH